MFDIMNQMDFNLQLNYVFVTNPPFSKISQLFKSEPFKTALAQGKFHYCLIEGMVGWTSEWADPYNHTCYYYEIPASLRNFIRPDGTMKDVHAVLVSDINFAWPTKIKAPTLKAQPPKDATTFLTSINSLNYYWWYRMQGWTFKIIYRPENKKEFKHVLWTATKDAPPRI